MTNCRNFSRHRVQYITKGLVGTVCHRKWIGGASGLLSMVWCVSTVTKCVLVKSSFESVQADGITDSSMDAVPDSWSSDLERLVIKVWRGMRLVQSSTPLMVDGGAVHSPVWIALNVTLEINTLAMRLPPKLSGRPWNDMELELAHDRASFGVWIRWRRLTLAGGATA